MLHGKDNDTLIASKFINTDWFMGLATKQLEL